MVEADISKHIMNASERMTSHAVQHRAPAKKKIPSTKRHDHVSTSIQQRMDVVKCSCSQSFCVKLGVSAWVGMAFLAVSFAFSVAADIVAKRKCLGDG
jgi:RAB protein geranylgeranyltransferase component A